MKRLTFIMTVVVGLSLIAFGLVGCGNGGGAARKAANTLRYNEQQVIDNQVRELRSNEPLPHFHDSAALHVQDAYYTADADPNKIWYVTLVSLDGTPYAHFTTRGAPQPTGDQVTNPQQQVCAAGSSNGPESCDTISLSEPNGVHQGAANDGYVAILTTGAMVRIPGNAVISDQPFNVTQQPKLTINENAAISATDSSKTDHAVIPKGTSNRIGG